jgi:hypothetical protein
MKMMYSKQFDQIAAEFSIVINTENANIMVSSGTKPVRSKICFNDGILEQINTFNYLGKIHPMKEKRI